jgi:RHS repeat-associated protein
LDIDTIENSGRLTLPEDTLTRVMAKCAWEYCIYVEDNDYGIYRQDGTKLSMPFGMLVQRTTGDSGSMKVRVSKALVNTPQAIRYTISTFDPDVTANPDSLWQGGSVAADVFPGTNETFGGEINGYGEITSNGLKGIKEYTIYYIYDGINPIVEYSPDGSILARYIYANGVHIAKISGADTNWYHCDALGSPRTMTNEIGAVTWTANYYPFGEMTAGSGNTHGFTGKEYDSEMGLNYFCQRYYDPQIGRFMTLDPLDSPASSPYAYCANNPFRFIDPTGAAMQVPMPKDDGGGGGYDRTWWALYNMRKMWEMHDIMEAQRQMQYITFDDEWENYSPGIKATEQLCEYVESLLEEKFEFLRDFEEIWLEGNQIEYMIHQGATTGVWHNNLLTRWTIWARENQWGLGSLARALASEFVEIIWYRQNKWTGRDLFAFKARHGNMRTPGHWYAADWVNQYSWYPWP